MLLMEGKQLLQQLKEHLKDATHIDIAVAWATECAAIEELKKNAKNKTKIRIVVGIETKSYTTDPDALRSLKKIAELRIKEGASQAGGIFHPKFYRFGYASKTLCWVGSANLTNRGFDLNDELVHEFEDKNGDGQTWFDKLWSPLQKQDPIPIIEKYQKEYDEYHKAQAEFRERWEKGKENGKQIPPLSNNIKPTWDDFVEGLRKLDEDLKRYNKDYNIPAEKAYDILGETHSYLHTIAEGKKIIRQRDWANLLKDQRNILGGKDTKEGNWALLGNMTERRAKLHKLPGETWQRIGEQIDRVSNADKKNIAEIAQDAVEIICREDDVGPASATRLLTLACPDRLVSVNDASADRLERSSGVDVFPIENITTKNRYSDLLKWLYDRPWFKEPQPKDSKSMEWKIWKYRAALLDAFVYKQHNETSFFQALKKAAAP